MQCQMYPIDQLCAESPNTWNEKGQWTNDILPSKSGVELTTDDVKEFDFEMNEKTERFIVKKVGQNLSSKGVELDMDIMSVTTDDNNRISLADLSEIKRKVIALKLRFDTANIDQGDV